MSAERWTQTTDLKLYQLSYYRKWLAGFEASLILELKERYAIDPCTKGFA